MAQARTVMDRMTSAIMNKDIGGALRCYADDAVAVTPEGELTGREQIIEWLQSFAEAFPDMDFKYVAQHEAGNVAIDEGYVVGTNTGPLVLTPEETIPATGKAVRLRACDCATVEDGVIVRHNFYYDQFEMMGQLGLLPADST